MIFLWLLQSVYKSETKTSQGISTGVKRMKDERKRYKFAVKQKQNGFSSTSILITYNNIEHHVHAAISDFGGGA